MEIKCNKCGKPFEPSTLEVGTDVQQDTELFAQCPSEKCGARFYTFASLSFEPLEN